MNRKNIILGACYSLANSVRLLEDALLLFEAGRFPSSLHMVVMAREELGKHNILNKIASTLICPSTCQVSEIKSKINPGNNGHKVKLKAGQSIFLFKKQHIESFEARQTRFRHQRDSDSTLLHSQRLYAQYVDINGDATWSFPNEITFADVFSHLQIIACEISNAVLWLESDSDYVSTINNNNISFPAPEVLSSRVLTLATQKA